MNASSPEVVTARTAAVMLVETMVRARTLPILLLATIAAVALAVVGTIADGGAAIFAGVFASLAAIVAAVVFVVRRLALAAIRRIGGGRHYEQVRPVIARQFREVRLAARGLPLGDAGIMETVRLVRSPSRLQDQLTDLQVTVQRVAPNLVDEVRAAMAEPDVSAHRA